MDKLLNEVNRWLGVKWTQSKYNKYLPTVADVAKYVNECLEARLKGLDKSKLAIPKEMETWPLQLTTALEFMPSDAPDGVWRLRLVSNRDDNRSHSVFGVFLLDIVHIGDDDDHCDAVRTLSAPSHQACDLLDVAACAIENIAYIGFSENCPVDRVSTVTFREAWKSVKPELKRKYPVCPRCGTLLVTSVLGDSWYECRNRYVYRCPECDFESMANAGTECDLFEKFSKNFDKEARMVDKTDAGKSEIEDILKEIEKQVERLKTAKKSRKFSITDWQIEQAAKRIRDLCETLAEDKKTANNC